MPGHCSGELQAQLGNMMKFLQSQSVIIRKSVSRQRVSYKQGWTGQQVCRIFGHLIFSLGQLLDIRSVLYCINKERIEYFFRFKLQISFSLRYLSEQNIQSRANRISGPSPELRRSLSIQSTEDESPLQLLKQPRDGDGRRFQGRQAVYIILK